MADEAHIFRWIDAQEERMIRLLKEWSSINSFTENTHGLQQMLEALSKEFSVLGGTLEQIDLLPHPTTEPNGVRAFHPTGRALHIIKRPQAAKRVLLGGHMDTVYKPSEHPILPQIFERHKLKGQGVADMKGGLIILLVALQAFEQHSHSSNLGWEVVISPDEEIGSPAAEELWKAAAKRNHVGLLFEPAFPDGALVDERGGSANWSIFAKGISAHSGRDFHRGRNAIVALASWIQTVVKLNEKKEATLNIGSIGGGGPVNIVADHAFCRANARVKSTESFEFIDKRLHREAEKLSVDGIHLSVHLDSYRAPKPLTPATKKLIETLNTCAKEEGYSLHYRASSGVCDGNIVAEEGIPVLDSLGMIGEGLHTPEEWGDLESLRLRCRLVTRFLLHMGQTQE